MLEMDRLIFLKIASQMLAPLQEKFSGEKVNGYFQGLLEDMADNLQIFSSQGQQAIPGLQMAQPQGDPFQPYQVNLLVDNSGQKGPPVVSYPTYKNLFGSIERIVDRSGIWRTDFSKIKAGSFVRANGGYLVVNLQDVALEPGVWPALNSLTAALTGTAPPPPRSTPCCPAFPGCL